MAILLDQSSAVQIRNLSEVVRDLFVALLLFFFMPLAGNFKRN